MNNLILLLLTSAALSAVDGKRLSTEAAATTGKKKHCIVPYNWNKVHSLYAGTDPYHLEDECWGASRLTSSLEKACSARGYPVQMGGCKDAGYHCEIDNGILNRTWDGYYIHLKPVTVKGMARGSCMDHYKRGHVNGGHVVDTIPLPKSALKSPRSSLQRKKNNPVLKRIGSKVHIVLPKKTGVRFDSSADEDTSCIKPSVKPYWNELLESATKKRKSADCPKATPYIVRSESNTRYCCSAEPESIIFACRFLYDIIQPSVEKQHLTPSERKANEYWMTGMKYKSFVGRHEKMFQQYDRGVCNKWRPIGVQFA